MRGSFRSRDLTWQKTFATFSSVIVGPYSAYARDYFVNTLCQALLGSFCSKKIVTN